MPSEPLLQLPAWIGALEAFDKELAGYLIYEYKCYCDNPDEYDLKTRVVWESDPRTPGYTLGSMLVWRNSPLSADRWEEADKYLSEFLGSLYHGLLR